jgi:hypothetical protein
MSAWTDTRRSARQIVHDTFAYKDARYYPQVGVGPGTQVSVRVHNRVIAQGDLGREGFAQMLDEVERIIFLTTDVDVLDVRKGGAVKLSDGRNYRLEVRRPARDDFSVEFEVTRQK